MAEREYGEPKYSAPPEEPNLIERVASKIRDLTPDLSPAESIAAAGEQIGKNAPRGKGATAANQEFLRNVERVEKQGPISSVLRAAMKPNIDATTKLLEQTNRPLSGVVGGIEAGP